MLPFSGVMLSPIFTRFGLQPRMLSLYALPPTLPGRSHGLYMLGATLFWLLFFSTSCRPLSASTVYPVGLGCPGGTYESGLGSRLPLLSYISKVDRVFHEQGGARHVLSIHLSGIVKGMTQFSAFAGAATALAVAVMSAVGWLKNRPMRVSIALPLAAVR